MIIKKAWELDLSQVEEGYLNAEKVVYAETRGKAKSLLLSEVKYEDIELRFTLEPLSFTNIPIKRSKPLDIVGFEGKEVKRAEVDRILKERKRIEGLIKILNDTAISHCYILKHGVYYKPDCNGYTDFKHFAGVYGKVDAVSQAKSCEDLRLVPIVKKDHNEMISKTIEDLKSRIIHDLPHLKSQDSILTSKKRKEVAHGTH